MPDLSPVGLEKESLSLSLPEVQIIDLFTTSAQVLGLPKSFGQIYGYLFAQAEPKTMEQIIQAIGISLGSASQGLKALRHLGAVRSVYLPGTKRDVFVAELELKKLMGGFIREQVVPHLESGKSQIEKLEQSVPRISNRLHRNALHNRVKKLKEWRKKAGRLLPLLEVLLKS